MHYNELRDENKIITIEQICRDLPTKIKLYFFITPLYLIPTNKQALNYIMTSHISLNLKATNT